MRKYCVLLINIFVFFNLAFSQNANDQYFDDGGISTAKNAVNVNLASIIVGDFSIGYERDVTNYFKLEFGVGVLLPYYNTELLPYYLEDGVNNQIINPKSGYSFFVYPKIHMVTEYLKGLSYGLMYRHRNYTLESNDNVRYNDYSFMIAYRFSILKYFVIDSSYGFGIRNTKLSNINVDDEDDISVIFPIQVKFLYIF